MFLGLRGHLLRDEFDWSFYLPPGPLGAVGQRLHGDVGLVAAGLVALGALPAEGRGGRETAALWYHLLILLSHTSLLFSVVNTL